MSLYQQASKFQVPDKPFFGVKANLLAGWLTSVSAADLTYHRTRQEKWDALVKIMCYKKTYDAIDVLMTYRQFAALKAVLTSRDYTQLENDPKLLFDVVIGELWEQVNKAFEDDTLEYLKQLESTAVPIHPKQQLSTDPRMAEITHQLDRLMLEKQRREREKQQLSPKVPVTTTPSTQVPPPPPQPYSGPPKRTREGGEEEE